MTMHRVTCPHCASALRVPETVKVPVVTCPRCLGRIPNPAAAATGARTPGKRGLADAEVGSDTLGLGVGLAVLVSLLVVGLTFLACMGTDRSLSLMVPIGCIGSFVIAALAALWMLRLFRRLYGAKNTRGEPLVTEDAVNIAAAFVGIVAGVMLLGFTCGAAVVGSLRGGR
jgi:hypothetical protein